MPILLPFCPPAADSAAILLFMLLYEADSDAMLHFFCHMKQIMLPSCTLEPSIFNENPRMKHSSADSADILPFMLLSEASSAESLPFMLLFQTDFAALLPALLLYEAILLPFCPSS